MPRTRQGYVCEKQREANRIRQRRWRENLKNKIPDALKTFRDAEAKRGRQYRAKKKNTTSEEEKEAKRIYERNRKAAYRKKIREWRSEQTETSEFDKLTLKLKSVEIEAKRKEEKLKQVREHLRIRLRVKKSRSRPGKKEATLTSTPKRPDPRSSTLSESPGVYMTRQDMHKAKRKLEVNLPSGLSVYVFCFSIETKMFNANIGTFCFSRFATSAPRVNMTWERVCDAS